MSAKIEDILAEIEKQSLQATCPTTFANQLSCRDYIESLVESANEFYRLGVPVVSDWTYDNVLIPALRIAKPDSDFLQEVEAEPEGVFGKTVELPERMLSTNKAYSAAEIEKWARDVAAVGRSLGMKDSEIEFRVTPKLDGFAAYDDGERFYTRGDGYKGTDITRAFDRGLKVLIAPGDYRPHPGRGMGKGEIVVDKRYFDVCLSGLFENSRNVIAAVIKEGDLDPEIQNAIADGAVVFAPFNNIDCRLISSHEDIERDLEFYWRELVDKSVFDTDGLVLETTNDQIKDAMGSTNHHHRWQIAFKKNTEFHNIRVTGLTWQTAKTGRITPVVELEPTKVSGVTISRATGHHLGNIRDKMINVGAVVKVCRSGQVIPYIADVVEPALTWQAPEFCPSCDSITKIEGDNLLCTNELDCPAQIERTIEYFFQTIGNCDGFGPKIIGQLVDFGAKYVFDIYTMGGIELGVAGISKGVADNLLSQLVRSRKEPIEDWRFLAAFSIPSVGKGGCERLLKHHRLEDVFELTVDQIVRIDGFAEKSATVLVDSLKKIRPQFSKLVGLFNLKRTPIGGAEVESPIVGKTVVFTGTMVKGSRSDMESQAKVLGAKVGSSVSSKTDYLICGANVGANKTEAAKKHGVKVLSEDEYLALIG